MMETPFVAFKAQIQLKVIALTFQSKVKTCEGHKICYDDHSNRKDK